VALAAGCSRGVLHVSPPTPANNVVTYCSALIDQLPTRLDGHATRVVDPRSPLTHAWGSPPIVLRCGVPEPPATVQDAVNATEVDGVTWLQQIDRATVRWTTVRSAATVELDVPTSYQSQGGLLVDLAGPIQRGLPGTPSPTPSAQAGTSS
jgi:hypothetical protein